MKYKFIELSYDDSWSSMNLRKTNEYESESKIANFVYDNFKDKNKKPWNCVYLTNFDGDIIKLDCGKPFKDE